MRLSDRQISFLPGSRAEGQIAYLLVGVVSLIALGAVLERYVFSAVSAPVEHSIGGRIALVASIALLSLGCFFMLRRRAIRAFASTQTLAYYDSLTSLPNRQLFAERLEWALSSARRHGRLVAVGFLDLDGFKRVNDTLGHSVGDRLLCEVAGRLANCVRLSDSIGRVPPDAAEAAVSRLGGDEFTFVLHEISKSQDAEVVARRVLDALRQPILLDGHELVVTASLGIAVFPNDGDRAKVLLRNADTAMYCAKDLGRDSYQFYNESMNAAARRKLELEKRIRGALERGEFSLLYQPIREATSGRLSGAEALLRWEDPDTGPVSAEEFIPIAEETGLIIALGEWVLRTACAQCRSWQDAGFRAFRVAVNLSDRQLVPETPEMVRRILEENGLSADRLELEITESAILHADQRAVDVFDQLSDMGVGLALDDFGTGYSSLNYLRLYPIGRVKIDHSLVNGISTNPDDAALTLAIIAMAHSLFLEVVAEGVETLDHANFLTESGCEELQGYLFSPPIPADEFTRFLEREKPA